MPCAQDLMTLLKCLHADKLSNTVTPRILIELTRLISGDGGRIRYVGVDPCIALYISMAIITSSPQNHLGKAMSPRLMAENGLACFMY